MVFSDYVETFDLPVFNHDKITNFGLFEVGFGEKNGGVNFVFYGAKFVLVNFVGHCCVA